MNKVRWLVADMPGSLDQLSARFKDHPFDANQEDSEGFRLEFVNNENLLGQHIEKETYIHNVILPSGMEYEEKRSIFTITEFVVFANKSLNLRLNDPPRKSSVFFNALMRALDYKFFVEYVDVNVLDWIHKLDHNFDKCIVRALDCSGVQISDGIVGRFAFKGTGDVRRETSKVLAGRNFFVESAACLARHRGQDYSFELYRSGVLKSTGELNSEVTRIVEDSLSDILRLSKKQLAI